MALHISTDCRHAATQKPRLHPTAGVTAGESQPEISHCSLPHSLPPSAATFIPPRVGENEDMAALRSNDAGEPGSADMLVLSRRSA